MGNCCCRDIEMEIKNTNLTAEYRLVASRDYDNKILEALNKIFTHVSLTKEWYEWFSYGSLKGKCFWFIGEDKGDIVCVHGFLPIEVMLNGKAYDSVLSVNSGAISSYWGKGLYQEFNKFSSSILFGKLKKKIIIGVPNDIGYVSHLRLGWIDLGKLIFIRLPKKTIETARHGGKKQKVRVIDFKDIPQELSSFLNKMPSRHDLFIKKDIGFIQWRYDRPDYKDSYRFILSTSSKGDIDGYMVIKLYNDTKENIKKMHIVDTNYESKEILDELLKFVCNFADEKGIDFINTSVYQGNSLCSDFLEYGFEKEGKERHLMAFIQDKALEDIVQKARNIHFTLGDNDVY